MSDVPPPKTQPDQGLTNVDLGLPPEGIQPRVLEPNPITEQKSKQLWQETRNAYSRGDRQLGDYFTELQRENALLSENLVREAGGNPTTEVAPIASWTGLTVEAERQYIAGQRQSIQMDLVLQENGIDEFLAYRQELGKRYREHNEGYFKELTGKETPEELLAYHQTLEPLVEDFAILQEWQQRLDKMNQAMKGVNPDDRSISVYTNSKTKEFAQWIGREMGAQNLGYVKSGEQERDLTVMQGASQYAFSMAEPMIDLTGKLLFGLGPALNALSGGRVGWGEPTNYIEDDQGNIQVNAGKVPGGVEFGAMMWNLFLNEDLKETIARANAAREWERHSDSTFDSITKGVGTGLGALFTYGGIMKGVLKFGSSAGGATARAVTQGLGKMGMTASEKSLKLAEILGRGLGGTSAIAMQEAVMNGRPGSYQKAITHGALLIPVLIGVGAAGKYFDRAISKALPTMPKRFVNGINGALQGGMFQALEDAQGHAIFGLIHDPSKSTLQRYIETMLSFGILKGMTGRGLPEFEGGRGQRARDGATDRLGMEIFQARKGQPLEVTEEQVRTEALRGKRARERELPQKLLGEKGEATQKRLTARTGKDRQRAAEQGEKVSDEIAKYDQREGEQGKAIEEQMEDEGYAPRTEEKNEELRRRRQDRRMKRIQEKAEGPSESDLDFMRNLGAEATRAHEPKPLTLREEIAKLRSEPETPESRRRVTELMEEARGTLSEAGAKFFGELGKQTRQAEIDWKGPGKGPPEPSEPLTLRDEIAKLRSEPATPESRRRIVELMEGVQGTLIDAGGKFYGELGKVTRQAEIDWKGPQRPSRGPMKPPKMIVPEESKAVSEPTGEPSERREDLERREQRDLTREQRRAGARRDAMKAVPEPEELTPEPTLEDVTYEVGYSGMSVDNKAAMDAAIAADPDIQISGHSIRTKNRAAAEAYRDALKALGAEAKMGGVTDLPGRPAPEPPEGPPEGPGGVDLNMPAAGGGPPGGRRVPGSMGEAASPHRAEFKEPKIGVDPIRASDVIKLMAGQPGHPGTRWPFITKPISLTIPLIGPGGAPLQVMGPVKGTAVVVPMRYGHLRSRTAGGVYDIFGNVARTKEGLNVIIAAHEWGHALQRQVFFTGDTQDVVDQATDWVANMAPDMLRDVWALLEGYGGRENLEPWRMGMEAWAEFVARKLLGDETVDAEAPVFAKMFRTWLAQPEQAHLRSSSWEPVKRGLTRYMEQGYEAQADEQFFMAGEGARVIVGSVRRALGEWLEDKVIDRLMRVFVDDVQPLKRAQERAFRAAGISMEDVTIFEDPARMLEVTRNMALAQTVNFFMKGRFNMAMEKIPGSEGLISIVEDAQKAEAGKIGGSTREFGRYLAHHRAWAKVRRGLDMGTPAKVYAESVLAKSRRHPAFKELARRTKVWTDGIVDFAVEGGLWSVEEGERMKDAGVIYVPLIAALEGPKKVAPGRGVAERGKGTKRFKGHTQEHKDPLQAMQEVVQDIIAKVYQNKVVEALYLASLRENMGRLVTVIDRSMVAQKYRVGEVWRSFKKVVLAELDKMAKAGKPFDKEQLLREAFGKLGPLISEADVSESLVTLFTQQNLPFGETTGIIAFTPHLSPYRLSKYTGEARRRAGAQNHKVLFLEVDPGVYSVFMAQMALRGPEHFLENPIARAIVLGPAKIMRNLAVRWNPLFGVVNAGRDIAVYPTFNPRTGLGVGARAVDAVKGLPLWWQGVARLLRDGRGDEVRQLFENSGVGMSMLWNEGVRAELIGQGLEGAEAVAHWIRKQSDKWSNFWSKGEGALRLSAMVEVYVNYQGRDKVERALLAAEAGKKATIDFAIGGTYARIATQMHPFITATINGMRRFVRSMAGSEGRNAKEKAANQRAAMLNAFLGMTVPQVVLAWLHSDEDWYRDKSIYEKISRIYWTEHIWTPLPFEAGVVAAAAPQAIVDYITGANPADWGDLLQEALFPYLKGLEGFFPLALQERVETITGFGFFFDSPITPRRLESKRREEQFTHNTTAAAQWVFNNFRGLVKLANIDNAIELEHFLNAYTAGKGTVGLRLVDTLFGLKDDPGFTRHFFSRFWKPRHSRSRILQQLYDQQAVIADIAPEKRTLEQSQLYSQMNQATKYFTQLRKAQREGLRTQEQIDKEMFERADAIMNPGRNK